MTVRLFACLLCFSLAAAAHAEPAPSEAPPAGDGKRVEVTADQSLEYYQDKRLYVARGNARAVRGDMTIDADVLTAHQREKQVDAPKTAKAKGGDNSQADTGDIDKMTAEGHVHISTPKANIWGERAVDDVDQHVSYLTGGNLKYATPTETVTATNSLEYWDNKKLAVARGNAVAVKGERHIAGDVLTAQFRDQPNGKTELQSMTALGHVTVTTGQSGKGDVSKGDKAVYDINRNIAVLTGNVRITRTDGTQLAGDVGEVDFAANQSRLMNNGKGRVKALLGSKTTEKAGKPAKMKAGDSL